MEGADKHDTHRRSNKGCGLWGCQECRKWCQEIKMQSTGAEVHGARVWEAPLGTTSEMWTFFTLFTDTTR